ncbi:hypothetical protein, partial [Bacillus pseudomycoides]|uniref:hypothetical protein n=2 Tax=Bacillaceae TaxID=186817 RepID=UPI000C0178FF
MITNQVKTEILLNRISMIILASLCISIIALLMNYFETGHVENIQIFIVSILAILTSVFSITNYKFIK